MYQPYPCADDLLQKASHQLRGQWPSAKRDDFQDYLNSWDKKTANMNSARLKDMSDISMSSDDVEIEFANSSGNDDDDYDYDNMWKKNKFFKHPTPFNMPQPKTLPTSPFVMSSTFPQRGPASSMLRPASRSGISIPFKDGRSVSQTSNTLNRASALVQKIERRVSGVQQRPKSAMKISFNIDSDKDLEANLSDKENSNDSDSDKKRFKSGRRFLKKPQPEEPAKTKDKNQEAREKTKPEKRPDSVLERRNSLMHSASIVLSSDDESMAEFIGKLSLPDETPVYKDPITQPSGRLSRNSSMERKPSILKQSPSPRQIHSPSPSLRNQNSRSPSPAFAARTLKHLHSVTEDLTLAESLPAEIVEEDENGDEPVKEKEDKVDQSKSTEKNMKLNLFNVEDLQSSFFNPEKNKTDISKDKKKLPRKKSYHSKSSRHSSKHSSRHSSKHSSRNNSDKSITEEILSKEHKIFSSFGLQTIEDLLPRSQHRSVSFDTGSVKVTSSRHEESVTEIVSEIHSHRSGTPLSRKHSSHSSVADAYTEDFVSANVSESDRNVYTEDFHTVSDMGASTLSDDTSLSASTNEMSFDESSKQRRKSRKSKKEKTKQKIQPAPVPIVIRVCNEGTQTNERDFIQAQLQASPWNSLYANQDWKGRPFASGSTKPVISATPHMCSHGGVNVHLLSQSNLTAVHEIMKQQLEFTRQFCESQKYLYHSLIDALTPDYVYTTLEDTKQYIKKHRKPRLTMKKALEIVELEMQTS